MSLGELRRWIREEVERNMRWSAGLMGSGGGAGHGDLTSLNRQQHAEVEPLPGLGPDGDEKEDQIPDEQEKQQAGARVYDRGGGPRGPDGIHRDR